MTNNGHLVKRNKMIPCSELTRFTFFSRYHSGSIESALCRRHSTGWHTIREAGFHRSLFRNDGFLHCLEWSHRAALATFFLFFISYLPFFISLRVVGRFMKHVMGTFKHRTALGLPFFQGKQKENEIKDRVDRRVCRLFVPSFLFLIRWDRSWGTH